MEIRIVQKKLLLIMVFFLCSVIAIVIGYFIRNTDFATEWLGIITLMNFICAEILIYKFSGSLFNFSNIFIIFLYLFHFGHVIIKLFDRDYYFSNLNLEGLLGRNTFILSELFSLLFVTFCVVGVVFKLENNYGTQFRESDKNENYNKSKLIFTGIVILLIALPIHFRISLQQIQVTAVGDYFDSFNVNVNGIQSAISSFLIIGIIMIMLAFQRNKTILYMIYSISVFYYAWTMMSGGRGQAVIAIILLTFVILKLVKVSIWKFIILVLLAYVTMKCLTAIAQIRNFGDISIEKILSAMNEVKNPIVSTLEEFGGTQWTVGLVFKYTENDSYSFGTTYLGSFLSILPNINGIFTEINEKAIFTYALKKSYIGGSIIGESYYNFGIFGCIIAYIVGLLVGKISMTIEKIIYKRNYNLFAYYVMPCFGMIWWVRDSFSSVCRNTAWSWLIITFLYYIYDHISIKRKTGIL